MPNPAVIAAASAVEPRMPSEPSLTEPPGGLVREAQELVEAANAALRAAVVAERTRNSSWAEIGDSLGITRASAHGRFAAVVSEFAGAVEAEDVAALQEQAKGGLDDAWGRAWAIVDRYARRDEVKQVADAVVPMVFEAKRFPLDDEASKASSSEDARPGDLDCGCMHGLGKTLLARRWLDTWAPEEAGAVTAARLESWPRLANVDTPSYERAVFNFICRDARRQQKKDEPSAFTNFYKRLLEDQGWTIIKQDTAEAVREAETEPPRPEDDRIAAMERRLAALEDATQAPTQPGFMEVVNQLREWADGGLLDPASFQAITLSLIKA